MAGEVTVMSLLDPGHLKVIVMRVYHMASLRDRHQVAIFP